MKKLGKLLLFTLLGFKAISQSPYTHESCTRIDPIWKQYYSSEQFIGNDIHVDALGNTYVAGTFLNFLQDNQDDLIREQPRRYFRERSPNHYFIAKHNAQGELLWINYANGQSRVAQITADDDGNIYVAGEVFSDSLEFISAKGANSFFEKPGGPSDRGLFIVKYNQEGHLLKSKYYTHNIAAAPAELKIDGKGDLVLCGNYTYQTESELISNYLLLKFDQNLNLLWEKHGANQGRSNISSLTFDRFENIYCTGYYNQSLSLGKAIFSRDDDYQHIFVVKLKADGEVKWVENFQNDAKLFEASSVGVKMDIGKWGHLYIAGNRSEQWFLMKLNHWHRIKWFASGIDRASYISDLTVHNNEVFICGNGYDTGFKGTDGKFLNYKSQGSTDFYVVKYDHKGKVKFLQAGGGGGTDYATSLALYKNGLHLLGHNLGGLTVVFKNTLINKRRPVLWLAKFDLEKLD